MRYLAALHQHHTAVNMEEATPPTVTNLKITHISDLKAPFPELKPLLPRRGGNARHQAAEAASRDMLQERSSLYKALS